MMGFTLKVWLAGKQTPVITVPKDARYVYNLKVGDHVQLIIQKIWKNKTPTTIPLNEQKKLIAKIWLQGSNTPVVTLPTYAKEVLNVQIGDLIEVQYETIQKKQDTNIQIK